MRLLYLIVLLIFVHAAEAQTTSDSTDMIIDVFPPMPELVGGIDTVQALLRYPPSQITTEGMVIVQFNVYADGKTGDAKIIRGLAPAFDAEALRVVSLLRFHVPQEALRYGMPVGMTLPIPFRYGK